MSLIDRSRLESLLMKVFEEFKKHPSLRGQYYTLTPRHTNTMSDVTYKDMVKNRLMFRDLVHNKVLVSAGIASDWPVGRGCFVSSDKGFLVWVGGEDHIKIICLKKGSVLNELFNRLIWTLERFDELENMFIFAKSIDYSYITSCPSRVGSGMIISVYITIEKLTYIKSITRLKDVASSIGLVVTAPGGDDIPIGPDGMVCVSYTPPLTTTEAQAIVNMFNGLKLLKNSRE
eukprot:GHVR01123257.1.p1 GENE.GHVR01123257.1~~GHVR01123257.1.p1  ORF type:complete len:239 (+),score=48.65 GHVR01123257.1:27-719(+)